MFFTVLFTGFGKVVEVRFARMSDNQDGVTISALLRPIGFLRLFSEFCFWILLPDFLLYHRQFHFPFLIRASWCFPASLPSQLLSQSDLVNIHFHFLGWTTGNIDPDFVTVYSFLLFFKVYTGSENFSLHSFCFSLISGWRSVFFGLKTKYFWSLAV